MEGPLAVILLLFGAGFLVANVLIMVDVWRFGRLRPSTVLTWTLPRPRPRSLPAVVAVGLALLLFYKLFVLRWPAYAVFGEGMMFLYYAIWYPLSFTVRRGFYRDGLWMERHFVRYKDITGLSWREDGPSPTLIVVSGHRQMAAHLTVPAEHFGEARRILRDRIADDQLHMAKPLLDLGGHDRREDV